MGIALRNLDFSYGDLKVLHDITLDVPDGKFSVILGRNGSGKSTLLKLIAGMLPYKHGQIDILGNDLNRLATSERAMLIGYLPQFHSPAFPFTVEDVVLTGRAAYVFALPGRKDKAKADEVIERVGIHELRHRPYTELSGGERQLVMIARVLAQEPKVILLDEPLSHLDLANQVRLLSLIRELVASGLTVMAVLHDPNIAFMYGDVFILMKDGTIRRLDKGGNPWDASTVTDLYGVTVEAIAFKDRALVIPV
jgi:iron complex transport system ATP-binding protein